MLRPTRTAAPRRRKIRRDRLASHRANLIEIYQSLNDQLASLDSRVAHLHDFRPADEMELAQIDAPEPLLFQLEENQRRTLKEVLAALGRLEDGTFGTCQHCQQAIAVVRLDALPMARYCLSCQESLEAGKWGEEELDEMCA